MNSRDRSLDGLRGLAALSVLAFHVWIFSEAHTVVRRESLGDYFFGNLGLGLYLFFALSGYLLYRSFARAAIEGRSAPRLGPYLRNRVARILPAYYVCMAASVLLLWGLADGLQPHMPSGDRLWLFGVFGQNYASDTIMRLNPPTWSLGVELAFYVLLPLAGALAIRGNPRVSGRVKAFAVPGVLLVSGLLWNAVTIGEEPIVRLALPAMLPYFACGMLAAAMHGQVSLSPRGRSGLLLLATALVGANVALHELAIGSFAADALRDLPSAAGFSCAIVALTCSQVQPRVLAARPLVALGTVSYGVYLWHMPLILLARGSGVLPDSTLMALMPTLVATLALATVSWFAIERPAIRWARSRVPAERAQRTPVASRRRRPAMATG